MGFAAISFLEKVSFASLKLFNKILSRLVAIALLILVFYYASKLFWYITYPQSFISSFRPLIHEAPKKATQVRNWSWFRDTAVAARKKAVKSNINARLLGVISQGEEEGVALVSVNNAPVKMFRINDELVPSIFLLRLDLTIFTLRTMGQLK